MAKATMYCKNDKMYRTFEIACTHTKEDCEKCLLKSNCNKENEHEEKLEE